MEDAGRENGTSAPLSERPFIPPLSPSPLRHWGVAFLVPFLLLLPATLAMGGTLPAAERLFWVNSS